MVSSDSAYMENYIAWFDFSVYIQIFVFDFACNLMYFVYSHMIFTGICHYIFAWSDLLRVGAYDIEFMSGTMVSMFIQPTVNNDIHLLIIVQFDTVFFVYSSLDSIILFSSVSLITLCSL